MIEYNYQTHVYYRDVDQMGIVYYSRYLEYFEAARTELLRSIGLDVTKIEEMGYYMPVISCSCLYKNSAKFDDDLIIITSVNEIPRSTMKIEYNLFNSQKKLLVTGETIHAFVNTKGKTVKVPKLLIEKIRG